MMTYLIVVFGVCCSAISFIFIRESTEPPVMLAAYRVLLAGVILLPWFLRDKLRHCNQTWPIIWKRSWLPGLILGTHFIAWVIGARMTPAANANLIVNLMPVVMPILMFTMFQERIKKSEIVATLLALGSLWVLSSSDFSVDPEHFKGDVICFISMLLFAAYLALARTNKSVPTVWLYIVPVYLVAGLSSFIVALFFSSPIHSYTPYNASMILLLALVSTVGGHSALNYGMQRLRGQTVTVINMGQFIIAGIAGYFVYEEVPNAAFYIASLLAIVAMLMVVSRRSAQSE